MTNPRSPFHCIHIQLGVFPIVQFRAVSIPQDDIEYNLSAIDGYVIKRAYDPASVGMCGIGQIRR